jgi:phenylpropionate dioxygenase-like ring-hydroxylating dioxygenase large terminal subunit
MATQPDVPPAPERRPVTPLPPDLGRRWRERWPQLGTDPVPVAPAVSREYFEWERDFLFKRAWLNLGTTDEIPNPGDYIVREVHCAKASILIMRGRDGEIRAFHNVCRHRGNKLVWDYRGHRKGCAWSCRFHGFTYDGSGELVFVPEEGNFPDALCGKLNLPPVAHAVYAGFVFVCLDPEPEESLESFLGPIKKHLDDYPFESLPHRYHYQSFQRSNWKLGLDAQSEVYHAPYLHGQTWPKLFNSDERPHVESLDMVLYDRHRYSSWPGNPNYSPKDVEVFALAKYSSIARLGETMDPSGPEINRSGAPDWGFDIVHLFPNTNVMVLPGVWHTHQFWPISENHMLWELKIHMPEPKSAGERFSEEYGRVLLRDALREDATTHERTQEALESGAISEIHLQDEETFVRHGYWAVDQEIRRYRDGKRERIEA